MAVLRIQHSFQGNSGSAKDQYVNTFHLLVGDIDPDSFPAVAQDIKDFYHVEIGNVGQHSIAWYMAPGADAAGARVKIFDTAGPPPHPPLYDEIYQPPALGNGSEKSLPNEVACCLSYAGVPGIGQPLASTRGRIYIGPLNVSALEEGATPTSSRPINTFRNALVQGGKKLAEDLAGIDPISLWVVHSEKYNTNLGIVRFWADDAWDTQRRRGLAATTRSTSQVGN